MSNVRPEFLLFCVVAICATVAAVFHVLSTEALAGVFGAIIGYAGKTAVELKGGRGPV